MLHQILGPVQDTFEEVMGFLGLNVLIFVYCVLVEELVESTSVFFPVVCVAHHSYSRRRELERSLSSSQRTKTPIPSHILHNHSTIGPSRKSRRVLLEQQVRGLCRANNDHGLAKHRHVDDVT